MSQNEVSTKPALDLSPLDDFASRKTAVIKFAQSLQSIANERGDTDAVAALDRFVGRFEENRFLVVVVGEFKRGKSTLVNALAERSICPVHVTPRTARLTRIRAIDSGGDEYVEIRFREDRAPERRPLAAGKIDDLVAHRGIRTEEVASVDVAIHTKTSMLGHGVVLVDTPGLESLFKDHDKITKEYLPRADLIIFCLSANQTLSARERDFLLTYRHLLAKVVITLNHFDIVPDDQRGETLHFVSESLREEVFGEEPPLYPVSARLALEVLAAGDETRWAESGVPALVTELTRRLAAQQGKSLLELIAQGERDVATGLMKQVSTERTARVPETLDLRDQLGRLEVGLARRSRELEVHVSREIEEQAEDLAARAAGRIEDWRERLKNDARHLVAGHASEAACRRELPRQLAQHVQGWLQEYEGHLADRFRTVSRSAMEQCRSEFEAMERDAAQMLAPGKARPGIAEIASGLDALANLSGIANCLGGPVGGYGLAATAIEPAFAIPPAVKVLTFAAGASSILAAIGGPIGWGVAVVGWLTVAIVNLVRQQSWQQRVLRQLEKAIDDEIIPRARTAVTTEIWTFGRGLQQHIVEHVRAVHGRLSQVVGALTRQIGADQQAIVQRLRQLEGMEHRLRDTAAEIDSFITNLQALAPADERR